MLSHAKNLGSDNVNVDFIFVRQSTSSVLDTGDSHSVVQPLSQLTWIPFPAVTWENNLVCTITLPVFPLAYLKLIIISVMSYS